MSLSARVLSLLVLVHSVHARVETTVPISWDTLTDQLNAWHSLGFDTDFAFNVGTLAGPTFVYTTSGGQINMSTVLELGSSAKWPVAVMIAGLVQEGVLSFQDRASKHLEWWATDSSDPRSNVTLASLLSFTSGYDADCDGPLWQVSMGSACTDFVECAREAYNLTTHHHPASSGTFAYASCHLQYAAAIALSASGQTLDQLLHSQLHQRFGMNKTLFTSASQLSPLHGPFPVLAALLNSTGNDMQAFLHRLLAQDVLSASVETEMERDWTKQVSVLYPGGQSTADLSAFMGHYGNLPAELS